jgi:hypothetical protein
MHFNNKTLNLDFDFTELGEFGMSLLSYNKTILIGRLAQDPAQEEIESSTVTKFSVLNTIVENGENKVLEHLIFVKGKQGALCKNKLKKGDLCFIEGKLCNTLCSGYDYFPIIAQHVVFLGNKRENSAT